MNVKTLHLTHICREEVYARRILNNVKIMKEAMNVNVKLGLDGKMKQLFGQATNALISMNVAQNQLQIMNSVTQILYVSIPLDHTNAAVT